jgi:hypothetical protein
MKTWLRLLVDTILGRVPGKTSRLDTTTPMSIDADFKVRGKAVSFAPQSSRERDDERLAKPIGPAADKALFDELIRFVNEAEEQDTQDEHRLYGQMRIARSSSLSASALTRSRF